MTTNYWKWFTLIAVCGFAGAGVGLATAQRADAPVAVAPVTAAQPMTSHAYLVPSGWASWDESVNAGITYWEGRLGGTPAVRIMRDTKNLCGPAAMACTVGYSDGSCRIWIKKQYEGERWALIAIGLHEVGHCMGEDHDDTDLIMHG